jgi:hypothetical protein
MNDPILDLRNKHRIYIWGFVFKKCKNSNIGEPVDFKENDIPMFHKESMVFIPYYVGKAETKSIHSRLSEHHNKNSLSESTFIRFDKNFLKKFFRDTTLINLNQKVRDSELLKTGRGKIVYINDSKIMSRIYQDVDWTGGKPGSLSKCNKHPKLTIKDTLKDLVHDQNNFWFCYAVPKIGEVGDSECLLFLESQTFWSLKGVTISKVDICSKVFKYSPFSIGDKYLTDQGVNIFKKSEKDPRKVIASDDFTKGYC